jgi:hypothetical protein
VEKVTLGWAVSYLLAGGTLALATVAVPGARALAVGKDKRVSTSKLQVVFWTYAILFALFALLFGYVISQIADAANWHAAKDLKATLGKGFDGFIKHGLDGTYLLLLGFPLTAAISAKGITASKVANGTVVKDEKDPSDPAQTTALQEAVGDDKGSPDIGDFQYLLFNLLALLYFLTQFLAHPAKGLPNLPDTLVGLTGVAAAAYVSKKGIYKDPPILYSVLPPSAEPGTTVDIHGSNLLADVPEPATDPPRPLPTLVIFGNVPARPLDAPAASGSLLKVNVPKGAPPGLITVHVIRPPGAESGRVPFEVVKSAEEPKDAPAKPGAPAKPAKPPRRA